MIDGDIATLRAGIRGQIDWFHTTCVLDALQSGCPDTVQWAFENTCEKPRYGHAWAMAFRQFVGNVATLDVLKRSTPWTEETHGEIKLYTYPVLRCVRDPRLVEWIVLNLGSPYLPPELLNSAVEARNWALVDVLLAIDYSLPENREQQVLLPSSFYRIYALANVLGEDQQEEKAEWFKLLERLLRRQEFPHDAQLEKAAHELGDVDTLKLVEQTRGIQFRREIRLGKCESIARRSLVEAYQNNQWGTVKEKLTDRRELASMWVLNHAARAGQLEVVKLVIGVLPLPTVDAAFFIAERFQRDNIANYLHELLYRTTW